MNSGLRRFFCTLAKYVMKGKDFFFSQSRIDVPETEIETLELLAHIHDA